MKTLFFGNIECERTPDNHWCVSFSVLIFFSPRVKSWQQHELKLKIASNKTTKPCSNLTGLQVMCFPSYHHRTKLCHISTWDTQKDVSAAGLLLPQCGIRWLWLPVKQQGRILLTYLVKAYLWNLHSRASEDTTYNRYSRSMSHINNSNDPFMDFIQLKRAARHPTLWKCERITDKQKWWNKQPT